VSDDVGAAGGDDGGDGYDAILRAVCSLLDIRTSRRW
jgi:hypothetical protein